MDTDTSNFIAARRAAIVDALNAASATFTAFSEESLDEVMTAGLLPIVNAVGVDRVTVYTRDNAAPDKPIIQAYWWDKVDGVMLSNANAAERLVVLRNNETIGVWVSALMRNECIVKRLHGGVSSEERELMGRFGVRSLMLVPVFTHGEFWGGVALLKRSDESDFSDGCIDLIYSAALLCANTIIRDGVNRKFKESFEALERSKRMTDTLNRAAVIFLSNIGKDFVEIMTAGMGPIAGELALDRLSVWRNFTAPGGVLHTSQIYRWDKVLGGTTEPTAGLKDVTYAAFAPRWEELLRSGGSINSPVSLLPEAEMLRSFGVMSAYVTPIIVGGKFWGFVLFEDRCRERYFEGDCIETMRSATFLCANAVMRTEMERDIKNALARATAASEAKGSFLSNMSHEMRTPLNTITGMASIGRNAPDLERKNYALGKIEEASAHLLGVINDVLDMSKIEAGKLELVPVECSFEKMLKKAVNAVSFRMEQKQQSFQSDIDGRIPHNIFADDQRLAQVVINLLSNAVKFTPECGCIRLAAALEEEGKDGSCTIAIEVSDTGIGIMPEHIERLFYAFEQADGGISRKFGGTGLGLAISKRIVEMMGGEINVVSNEGAGSVFRFTFKAARGKDAGNTALDSSENWETGKGGNLKGCNILLVEDVEINREILIASIEGTGVNIDCAENGLQALRMLSKNPGKYGLIFMDVQMPEMDGLEATQHIRKSGNKIPIVAMTANVFKEDIEKCIAAGMNDHLGKPLDIVNVIDKVRKYCTPDKHKI